MIAPNQKTDRYNFFSPLAIEARNNPVDITAFFNGPDCFRIGLSDANRTPANRTEFVILKPIVNATKLDDQFLVTITDPTETMAKSLIGARQSRKLRWFHFNLINCALFQTRGLVIAANWSRAFNEPPQLQFEIMFSGDAQELPAL